MPTRWSKFNLYGDSLLTTENNEMVKDKKLISEFSDKRFLKSNNNRF